jgi:uncharacterized membrane protein YeaQ/YmgE (transglycosylase-associated protein family)
LFFSLLWQRWSAASARCFSRGGCLVSIVIGFIGAYIGTWLAQTLSLPQIFVLNIEGQPFPLVWAIIGAAVFAGILNLLSGRRAYY